MIKNVVFDIGNVLAYFCWDKFMKNLGFSEEEIDELSEATVRSPQWTEIDRGVLIFDEVINLLIKNNPSIEKNIRYMMQSMVGIVEKADYAIPWIKDLKSRGCGVYYLSNFSEKAADDCAEALDFIPYTDGGILSFREKLVKPDHRIYELLTERYGLKPEECIFIDDTPVNVEAARKCGWQGIVFTTRKEAVEELEKRLNRKAE